MSYFRNNKLLVMPQIERSTENYNHILIVNSEHVGQLHENHQSRKRKHVKN